MSSLNMGVFMNDNRVLGINVNLSITSSLWGSVTPSPLYLKMGVNTPLDVKT